MCYVTECVCFVGAMGNFDCTCGEANCRRVKSEAVRYLSSVGKTKVLGREEDCRDGIAARCLG